MLATVDTATIQGAASVPATVDVCVDAADALPSFTIVGKPDGMCREARDRVRAAILSSGLEWPQRRITVNIDGSAGAPLSSSMDLPIAVGVLAASEQLAAEAFAGLMFFGEMSLDGRIPSSRGALSLGDSPIPKVNALVVPFDDATAVQSLVKQAGKPTVVLPASDLRSLVESLRNQSDWAKVPQHQSLVVDQPKVVDVICDPIARQAAEVAAAGGHHLLIAGPAASSRFEIAQFVHGLLPDLTDGQAREVASVWSAAGAGNEVRVRPPWRAPHHTATTTSLIGGGTAHMRPGEFSLAHHGVLCLQDIGEFTPFALDAIRFALRESTVRVARGQSSVSLPASFQLVATMNQCPCGRAPERCRCSENARQRYRQRLAGPLVDQLDLRISISHSIQDKRPLDTTETASAGADRVARARDLAAERTALNADLPNGILRDVMPVVPGAAKTLRSLLNSGQMNSRGAASAKRVALTLCDLAGEEPVLTKERLEEACRLRSSLCDLARPQA